MKKLLGFLVFCVVGFALAGGYSVAPGPLSVATDIRAGKDSCANFPDTNGLQLKNWWSYNDSINITSIPDSLGGKTLTLVGGCYLYGNGRFGRSIQYKSGSQGASCTAPAAISSKQKFTFVTWSKERGGTQISPLTCTQSGTVDLRIQFSGVMYSMMRFGGEHYGTCAFTLSNVWKMHTIVFDGSLSDNAARNKYYSNNAQQTLEFTGDIAATTSNFGTTDFFVPLGLGGTTDTCWQDNAMLFGSALSGTVINTIYAAKREIWKPDTCNGLVLLDTAWNHLQLDTARAWHNASSDTLTKTTLFSSAWNIKSLFSSFGTVSYDTNNLVIDSIFTVNRKDTINFTSANNIGRCVSGAVQHIVQVKFSDTTSNWRTVPTASSSKGAYKSKAWNKDAAKKAPTKKGAYKSGDIY